MTDPIKVANLQAPTPAPVQAPVKPPETPKPAAIPTGAPVVPPQEDKMVPIAALHEEREKRQSLQAELESLRKIAGQNVLFDVDGKPVSYQQPQQAPQVDYAAQMDKLWETDPRKAVQAEIYAAMTWRDNQDAMVDHQEEAVRQKFPDYSNYASEVRSYIRTLPIDQRGTRGVVELAYYVVKGQKVDNIISKTKEQLEAEWRQKAASGEMAQGLPGGSMSQLPSPTGVVLSNEQKAACMALNISEADYIKHMKG